MLSDVPLGIAVLVPFRSQRNYAYETTPQAGFGGRKGFQPRGRGLGGSSLINAMIYMRGQPQDYDRLGVARLQGLGMGGRAALLQARPRTMREDQTSGTASAGRCTSAT